MESGITVQWGTLIQWIGTLITIIVVPLIGLFIRWVYNEFKNSKEHNSNNKAETDRHLSELKQEILVRSKSIEAMALGAKTEVSRLETKVATEYLSKMDFDRTINTLFDQLFLRMSNLEGKVDRLYEMRLK